MTTRQRFSIWASLAGALAVLVAGAVAVVSVELSFERVTDARLDSALSAIDGGGSGATGCAAVAAATGDDRRMLALVDGFGVERCRSSQAAPSPRALGFDGAAVRDGTSTEDVDGVPWRVGVREARLRPGASGSSGAQLRIIVAEEISAQEDAADDAQRAIGWAMLAGIIIAALIGVVASGPATSRIMQLLQRVERAAADPTGAERAGAIGSSDLDRASASFDELLDRIRQADTAQRRLFADVAHELRTPLTSIHANAQLLERGASGDADLLDLASRIASQSAGAAKLVARLVDHAAVGAWSVHGDGLVPLEQVVRAAVQRADERWGATTIETRCDATAARMDRELAIRALGNLIDNAVQHGGSSILITVAAGVLAVEDDGPGFSDEFAATAFEPFSRKDSGAGSGLGLAFVAHVASAHGGAARIARLRPARVEVTFGPTEQLSESS